MIPLLDIAELARTPRDHALRAAAEARSQAKDVRRSRVLVVDDSMSVRRAVATLLEDQGYDVAQARDGLEAVKSMEIARPDVLLTDLEMPNMNGLELAAHVRSRAGARGPAGHHDHLTFDGQTSPPGDVRGRGRLSHQTVHRSRVTATRGHCRYRARRKARCRRLTTQGIAMSNKTRVLNVRVVGFSAPERQMLNSIFLLSVAPARQIGYKLWNPEAGVAPDMYLLDGDSESAVASWQATFSSTSDRTLVVGSKNMDLGVASASRPLGLKVVGAMDRLGLALDNVRARTALHDVSGPARRNACRRTLRSNRAHRARPGTRCDTAACRDWHDIAAAGAVGEHEFDAADVGGRAFDDGDVALPPCRTAAVADAMTAAAPAATVLPNVTLAPNVAPAIEKSINEKPVTEKAVDRILSDKPATEKTASEKILASAAALVPSGVMPLSPSALSAAVAPTPARANLRVVPNPSSACRLAARRGRRRRADRRGADGARRRSAPRRAACVASARLASPMARSDAGRARPPCRPRVTRNTSSACSPWTTAR